MCCSGPLCVLVPMHGPLQLGMVHVTHDDMAYWYISCPTTVCCCSQGQCVFGAFPSPVWQCGDACIAASNPAIVHPRYNGKDHGHFVLFCLLLSVCLFVLFFPWMYVSIGVLFVSVYARVVIYELLTFHNNNTLILLYMPISFFVSLSSSSSS